MRVCTCVGLTPTAPKDARGVSSLLPRLITKQAALSVDDAMPEDDHGGGGIRSRHPRRLMLAFVVAVVAAAAAAALVALRGRGGPLHASGR